MLKFITYQYILELNIPMHQTQAMQISYTLNNIKGYLQSTREIQALLDGCV